MVGLTSARPLVEAGEDEVVIAAAGEGNNVEEQGCLRLNP